MVANDVSQPLTIVAVLAAHRASYCHVDMATVYRNEAEVGDALCECGIPCTDVFVTTKLWNDDLGCEPYESHIDAIVRKRSLR